MSLQACACCRLVACAAAADTMASDASGLVSYSCVDGDADCFALTCCMTACAAFALDRLQCAGLPTAMIAAICAKGGSKF